MPRSSTFPLRSVDQRDGSEKRTLRVGIGGKIQSGKGTLDHKFLQAIQKATETSPVEIEILAGFPASQRNLTQLPMGIRYVDTADYAAYKHFILSLDVLVVNLRQEDYWYRTSGVVQDALSAGVFVIVNDFPVVRCQVTEPVKVGEVYSNLDQLTDILSDLAADWDTAVEGEFRTWNDGRSIRVLRNELANAIDSRTAKYCKSFFRPAPS